MRSPGTTRSPERTNTVVRNEYDVFTPPWSIVTVRFPTTTPEKLTVPASAAPTAVPTGAAKSMPQCPA